MRTREQILAEIEACAAACAEFVELTEAEIYNCWLEAERVHPSVAITPVPAPEDDGPSVLHPFCQFGISVWRELRDDERGSPRSASVHGWTVEVVHVLEAQRLNLQPGIVHRCVEEMTRTLESTSRRYPGMVAEFVRLFHQTVLKPRGIPVPQGSPPGKAGGPLVYSLDQAAIRGMQPSHRPEKGYFSLAYRLLVPVRPLVLGYMIADYVIQGVTGAAPREFVDALAPKGSW